jgi:thiamine biosynthesis lipoprotein
MDHCTFHAMGCEMLALLESDAPGARTALDQVPAWFASWERQLSRFRDDSELARLNRSAGRPVRVSKVLWDVVEAALDGAAQSGGLVTPTLLGALEAAGYDRSWDMLQTNEAGATGFPRGVAAAEAAETKALRRPASDDLGAIQRDPATRTIRLLGGVRLDLGGVAKGWAADRAARLLGMCGPALVDAGGDIAVSGPLASGAGWPVGVADPFAPEANVEVLVLAAGGVATSGRDYRRWQRDGAWHHHIIDPRSGRPATTDVLSATVVGPSARAAEVAAKAALILGSREGLAWIEARPELAGLLVLESGRIARSRRLSALLR